MRPNRQMAVAIKCQRAGGSDRGMREIASRVNRLVALQPARGICFRCADDAIEAGALQQPIRFRLQGARPLDAIPMSVVGSCSRSGFYGGFIVADDRQKIAVADETDRTARRIAASSIESSVAPRLG